MMKIVIETLNLISTFQFHCLNLICDVRNRFLRLWFLFVPNLNENLSFSFFNCHLSTCVCFFFYCTLCNKVCQWLATGRWFSPGTPVSSTNKTDRHDTTEILMNVALNAITRTHLLVHSVLSILACFTKNHAWYWHNSASSADPSQIVVDSFNLL